MTLRGMQETHQRSSWSTGQLVMEGGDKRLIVTSLYYFTCTHQEMDLVKNSLLGPWKFPKDSMKQTKRC